MGYHARVKSVILTQGQSKVGLQQQRDTAAPNVLLPKRRLPCCVFSPKQHCTPLTQSHKHISTIHTNTLVLSQGALNSGALNVSEVAITNVHNVHHFNNSVNQ